MMKLRLSLLSMAVVAACGSDSTPTAPEPESLTYYKDAKAIVDARCATCHQVGDIGPFPLTTYADVMAFAGPVRAAVANGTMPPWQPSDDCNQYEGSIDLTEDEKTTLLAWLDADAPEGDPSQMADSGPEPTDTFSPDLTLQLPEPYTPTREPDDYRCQLIPWPAEETRFVTGLRVSPDQRAIVHHVIVFVASPEQVEEFQAYDEAEEGPGYTCYGGPAASTGEGGGLSDIDPATLLATLQRLGISLADLQSGNLTPEQIAALVDELGGGAGGFQSLGSWVPGIPSGSFPEGTGIRMEPGSMLVAQFHYNTLSSAPAADQSVIEISTASSVEREATNLAMLDFGWVTNGMFGDPMTIPAGESNVQHSTTIAFDSPLMARARAALGIEAEASLVVHRANHHMHELGTQQRTELRRANGDSACVLDIPDWDFAWQGSYALKDPLTIRAGDEIWMGCTWNNSAANQPIIDGQVREPADVSWGEGTSDEMCLGSFYVTAE